MAPESSDTESLDSVPWELVARHLSGDCSPDEKARLQKLLDADPQLSYLIAFLQDAASSSRECRDGLNTESALLAVRERMKLMGRLTVSESETVNRTFNGTPNGAVRNLSQRATAATPIKRSRVLVFAFAATALIAVGIALWPTISRLGEDNFAITPSQLYATAPLQTDSVTLLDGTQLFISPGSTIHIDSGFNQQHRTVKLDGTARFVVASAGGLPFTVRTDAGDVVDIGTAFVVRTNSDSSVVVSVTQGAVRIVKAAAFASADDDALTARSEATIELYAGDRALLSLSTVTSVNRGGLLPGDTAWTSGRFVYSGTPVKEVIAELERWFGASIVADSAALSAKIQGDVSSETVSEVLNVVAMTIGAQLEQRNGVYYLSAGKDHSAK